MLLLILLSPVVATSFSSLSLPPNLASLPNEYTADGIAIGSIVVYDLTLYTWPQARDQCQALFGPEARLGAIRSADFNEFLLGARDRLTCGGTGTWIGYSQSTAAGAGELEPTGGWCWEDGTCDDSYYTPWGPNQPDDFANEEHCAVMPPYERIMNDLYCGIATPCFLCEMQCEEEMFLDTIDGLDCVSTCSNQRYGNPVNRFCQDSCPTGFYADSSRRCHECPEGKYAVDGFATACWSCQDGEVLNEERTGCDKCFAGKYLSSEGKCVSCDPGFGSDDGDRNCEICPIGKFSLRGTGCLNCPKGKFSDVEGASECQSCSISIKNESLFIEGAKSIRECESCIGGFFRNEETDECVECFPGKYREQFSTSITSCNSCPPGRYSNQSRLIEVEECDKCPIGRWLSSGGKTSENSCEICPDFSAYEEAECPEGSPYPFVKRGYYRSLNDPTNVKRCVPMEACQEGGFNSTPCSEGYQADLCSECIPLQYYRKGRYCIKCGSQWLKWILITSASVVFVASLLIVSLSSSKVLLQAKITIGALQVIASFGRLSENFAKEIRQMFDTLSFSNVDLQLFSFECNANISFWTLWILKVLFPLFFAVILFVLYLLNRLLRPEGSELANPSRFICAFVSLYTFLFFPLIVALFEPLQCVAQPDKTFVMLSDSSMECFSKEWNQMVIPVLIIFGSLYLVILPSLAAFAFWNKQNLENFSIIFGVLVIHYQDQYYWYEWVSIARKFALIVIPDVLSSWM